MTGRDEYRVFPIMPTEINWADENEVTEIRTVTVRMPQWATDEMIHRIVGAITKWRYAHTNPTELVVWVPRSWLTESELARGYGAGPGSILGVPMLYGPVTEVIVGVRV